MEARSKRGLPAVRIHQAIARDLGIAILAGEYQPGHGLPGEIEYSEQLKISRTPYREAMRILVAKGLLESRPKAGTHVTPRSRWNLLDPEVLAWAFAREPDPAFVRDLFELRSVIEPAAAAFAATRRTADHLKIMEDSLRDMEAFSLTKAEGRAADQNFHKAILVAAGNEPLAALASSVSAAVSLTTKFKQEKRGISRDPLPDHAAVYDAIAASNQESARIAMAELVRLALVDIYGP